MLNRLLLFILLLVCTCNAQPSGPAFPHQLVRLQPETVPFNESVSWLVAFPSNKPINPLQSSMVGLDTRVSWSPNMTSNSCFNLTASLGIARANGEPIGSRQLVLYSKILCVSTDGTNADIIYPVSPCQLNQLVKPNQDIPGIQLRLSMSIAKPNNPVLPYDPLTIATNASVVFVSAQLTNQWQWDSNLLCQATRYYMTSSKVRTNPVFSITNESIPSVGLGSVGGCLPDELGDAIATYSGGGKVSQSGNVLRWKAQNVPKGTLSISVEVNGGVASAVCSMYAKIDMKTNDDEHQTHVVLAVTFSLLGALIVFVAVIVLVSKYRAKKKETYVEIL